MFNFDRVAFNFALLLKCIAKRDIQLEYLSNTDAVVAKKNDHIEYLVNYQTRLTPINFYTLFNDKFYSKQLMSWHGFSTPNASVFSSHQIDAACAFAMQLGYPVVLKPTNASQGNFVYANIKNEFELRESFNEFSQHTAQCNMMIEDYFSGIDYRFLLIDGAEPFVIRRTVPTIVGDGILTINELIEQENARRMEVRRNCLCTFNPLDNEAQRVLRHQSMTFDSIPSKGHVVTLRYNANVSCGGECETLSKADIHPSYMELVNTIRALFPGNGILGIDLLISDVSLACTPQNYVFCEFAVEPGFSLHLMPSCGASQNVLDPIVDLLFPETKQ